MTEKESARQEVYAQRVLNAQDVIQGSVAMNREAQTEGVPPLHVAAVLHALADHTHNIHMLRVADEQLLDDNRATSLGRYFHALADVIEWAHYLGTAPATEDR